jgi:pimeloyl-ACP methyl ester carboxylesterase
VLATRQPYHGLPDRLTRSLRDLEPEEIIEHVDRTIDLAAGFGEPLYVLGLSGGGVQAAWAAATREEVRDVLVISPATSPGWSFVPMVRLFVRFRRLLPDAYIWWDPRTKSERVQSAYEYPGFPLPGIIPLLYMGIELGDRRVTAGHPIRRAVLLTNPNDYAVSRSAARWMMRRTFGGHAAELREVVVAKQLHWGHDFIDPASRKSGRPSQVADVVLAAFGLAEDTTAGGLISPGHPL